MKKLKNSKPVECLSELVQIYFGKHVSRSAAELSYFITLSFFPTLICIYSIMVRLLPGISITLEELQAFIPGSTFDTITDYLGYVARHNNKSLLTAGIIGMATTSAASFRSLHNIMADIQGKSRYRGIFALVFSFIFSLLFLGAIYFAGIVMVTGSWLVRFLTNLFPPLAAFEVWPHIRFPLLFLIFILIIYGLYRITAPKDIKGGFLPGAAASALILVAVSVLFSWFISMSTKYPLIYGSLASIIVFMLWMYICGQILIMGNAFNVVLRRHRGKDVIKNKNKADT
ncbi:MAG: YihY/virulence factor BrkB family protein [Clostridiales bacterium]|nr:YihY/virulence factor BrkB family protein [Clostridiales bacterium]